ncbi:uracil-DNA glycosylase [Candidatus Bathyarchaeota archaeon]|nr:uracil-DNA glycosylase [Candidatus Bathyarchaeota archaeon]
MALNNHLKLEAFAQLTKEIYECRKCSLWKTRKRPVVGDGDTNACIILVGEAPGYWEDVEGKPFIGAAGKLLNEFLKKVGLSRESIYITNVVKCRPPGNRDPHPEEIKACGPYLDRQLDLIRPKVIVPLGRHSTSYIFSKAGVPFKSISEVQGKIFEAMFWETKTYLIPSYHPAVALYRVKLRSDIERALSLAAKILNNQIMI